MNQLGLIVGIGLVLLGLLILVCSSISFHVPKCRPLAGVLLLLLAGGLFLAVSLKKIASAPPGDGRIIDNPKPIGPQEPIKGTPGERLLRPWDSNEEAWPGASIAASLSLESYSPPIDLEESLTRLGFQRSKTVVHSSILGYILSNGDLSVIVFRGTDDAPDWLANLDVDSEPTPHGRVHRGFSRAYQALRPQIQKILNKQEPKHVWITGHSLGGAIAVLCAYDFVTNEQFNLDGLMTFGQPMIGDQQMASYLDRKLQGKYLRFVNESDIVARVPPTHYAHCGTWIWFKAGAVKRAAMKVIVGDNPNALPPLQETPPPPLSRNQFEAKKAELRAMSTPKTQPDGTPVIQATFQFIEDHSMDMYLKKVRELDGITGALPPRP